jgi:cation-transporting ATPase 13A1
MGQGTPDFQSKASSEDMVVPCDALIIRGSCLVNEAMLTGESVPQIKESISCADDKGGMVSLGRDNTIDPQWKRHLVLGGTVMLQHSPLAGGEKAAAGGKDLHSAPDKGCVAVVVRTGYGTIQGGLMRKILFATERVNANSSETFAFIGVLVVFAVLASVVVLHGGLQDENRNRFKLALHCIMIITSVVPPELPMELSLAVTNSLGALSRHLVFCTEPFRIPFAGKLDILCFDKTGTLTKDKMILKGVVSARHVDLFSTAATKGNDEQDEVTFETVADPSAEDSPAVVSAIMASCHSLVLQQPGQEVLGRPNYLGDPLEVATMMSSGFIFERGSSQGDGSMAPSATSSVRGLRVSIKHRFPFNSTLKRMSVLTEVQDVSSASVAAGSSSTSSSGPKSKSALYIFTKGAPEVIQDRLASVPASYTKAYVYHMCRGKRVLALACRKISTGVSDVLKESRENIERDLIFVGFLVYDCDLKIDSKSVIKELKGANHKLAMITGDSVYTAIDVSRRLGMLRADAPILVLHSIGKRGLVWRKLAESGNSKEPATGTLDAERVASDVDFSDDRSTIASIAQSSNVTISGAGLGALIDSCGSSVLSSICPHVVVFARVSPAQKEIVLRALNDSGLYTLMCGDGTNDVGALKAAHVGVSIVNDADFESRIEGVTDSESTTKKGKKAKGSNSKDRLARAMAELQEQEVDPTVVKLGDASIASPFTSRRTSIDSVLTVIRQGRATQVTTVQVFKILALNCLVSAYMMSALYLRGLKQGDMQMTATGLITAALFFFLSQAKPLIILAPHKPPGSAFAPSVMVSVVGQFVVHLGCLVATLSLCEQYSRSDDLPTLADGKFQPNVVNSATFLLSAVMQVNNFVVNYRGHPFTQSIQENVMLWRSVQGIYAALLVVMGGQLEPLNDFLQLAPFPSSEFQASLLAILLVNFGLTFGLEKAAQRLE